MDKRRPLDLFVEAKFGLPLCGLFLKQFDDVFVVNWQNVTITDYFGTRILVKRQMIERLSAPAEYRIKV